MNRYIAALLLCYITSFGQITWKNQEVPGLAEDIWSVAYAEETFVAVTGKGRVLTSNDGVSWSVQTVASGTWFVSVAYGAGLWVVVGDGGNIYYSGADLKVWNVAKKVTADRINGVCFTGKTFIAVTNGGSVLTSSDAQVWKLTAGVSKGWLHGITVAPPVYPRSTPSVFVSGAQGTLIQSYDEGISWEPASSLFTYRFSSYPPVDDIEALAVRSNPSGPWTLSAVGGNGLVGSFAGALSALPSQAYLGLGTWSTQPRVVLRGVTYGSGVFVAVGEQGSIFTSVDGAGYVPRFSGERPDSLCKESLLGVAYAEPIQRFVAVGANGTILTSDGSPSTLINVSTRGTVSPLDPMIGGFVVTGVERKYVLVRAVGPTLSSFGVPNPLPDPSIKLVDSRGVTVATNTGWGNNSNRAALVTASARVTFPLGVRSADSALYVPLAPGSYTATVTSATGASGTVLFEAYSP